MIDKVSLRAVTNQLAGFFKVFLNIETADSNRTFSGLNLSSETLECGGFTGSIYT